MSDLSRRDFLNNVGIGVASAAAFGASSSASAEASAQQVDNSLTGPYLDVSTPEGNMTAYARERKPAPIKLAE